MDGHIVNAGNGHDERDSSVKFDFDVSYLRDLILWFLEYNNGRLSKYALKNSVLETVGEHYSTVLASLVDDGSITRRDGEFLLCRPKDDVPNGSSRLCSAADSHVANGAPDEASEASLVPKQTNSESG